MTPYLAARASLPATFVPRPGLEIQREGLRYEKKVQLALAKLGRAQGWTVEPNPWFRYKKTSRSQKFSHCQPDALIHDLGPHVVVVEIKLAATPLALEKLESLYVPIVASALGLPTKPLIITRSFLAWHRAQPNGYAFPDHGLSFTASLRETIDSLLPLYLWSGRGQIT